MIAALLAVFDVNEQEVIVTVDESTNIPPPFAAAFGSFAVFDLNEHDVNVTVDEVINIPPPPAISALT